MLEAPFADPNTRLPGNPTQHPASRGSGSQALDAEQEPVSSIMTTKIISFRAATTVEDATGVMLERGISGAPVVDEHGRPVGMLSKTDLLEAWQAHKARQEKQRDTDGADIDALGHSQVGDIMVPYLLAVSSKAPISLASALMAYEGVHRLLVLNDSNEMVGIVSALDVLRWLAQQSGFCLPRYTQRQRGEHP